MLIEHARTLRCPGRKQLINTLMTECRYCAQVIDTQSAQEGADLQDRIHQACSDASYMIALGALTAFYAVSYLPLLGIIGSVAFLFLLVAIPIMCIRWFIRVRNVETDDPDFKKAKTTIKAVLSGWMGWLIITLLVE
jgi:hypothetical protein